MVVHILSIPQIHENSTKTFRVIRLTSKQTKR